MLSDAPQAFQACCLTQESNMTDIAIRNADLKRMLGERRREMQDDLQSRIRDGRTDRPTDVRDDFEASDADTQGDIEFALI